MMTKKLTSIILAVLLMCTALSFNVFAQASVAISGESTFLSAPAGTYSELQYVATYSSGVEGEADITDGAAFSWSVTKDGAKASDVWCLDGSLVVAGGAEGTYILTATHIATGVKSGDFAIVVKPSTTLYQGDEYIKATNSKLSLTLNDSKDITSGVKTVKFKFRVPANATGTSRSYLTEEKGWKESIKVNSTVENDVVKSYRLYRNYSGSNYVKDMSGADIQFDADKWYEFAYVYDMTNSKYAIYINGEHCKISSAESVSFAAGMSSHNYYVYNDICDAVVYSGKDYNPNIAVDSDKYLYIPQSAGKKACVQFSASSLINGSDGIVWSVEEKDGVLINPSTGVVTVTDDASAGDVVVTATQGELVDTAVLHLYVINENINSFTVGETLKNPWINSVVASDGSDIYISKVPDKDYAGLYFPKDGLYPVNGEGSIVVEFRYKSAANSTGVMLKKYNVSNWDDKLALIKSDSWTTVKFIYNPVKNTSTVLINGFIQKSQYNKVMSAAGKDADVERVCIYADIFDDLRVYNVTNSNPEAYNVSLPMTAPGENMTVSYNYVDDGAAEEDATSITWAYADSKDSKNWTAIPAYENKKTLDAAVTSELDNKYIKAIVTPGHTDKYNGGVLYGESVEVVSQITDMVIEYSFTKNGESFNPETDSLKPGETLALTLSAEQVSASANETYMVVLAKYSIADNTLLAVDAKDVVTEKGSKKSESVAVKMEEGTKIKAFIWNKNGIKPVINSITK